MGYRVSGTGFGAQGLGYRVWGTRFGVQGLRYKVWISPLANRYVILLCLNARYRVLRARGVQGHTWTLGTGSGAQGLRLSLGSPQDSCLQRESNGPNR